MRERVVIVGGGMGGLAAAVDLAAHGVEIVLVEKEAAVGGKARRLAVAGRAIDAGPTVFTMRWVFDALLDAAGTSLEAIVPLGRAEVLARHAWSQEDRLDLFADVERSAEAVGDFAGAAEASRYRGFIARAREVYGTLEGPFLRGSKPNPVSLIHRVGPTRLGDLMRLRPLATLWQALGDHFADPRLRQLYGRYATYCGSSPFEAPATLMLVAHVEQDGVWYVEGGISALAGALARVATDHGATIRTGETVAEILVEDGRAAAVRLASGEVIEAAAVIVNADANAVASGLFGAAVARAVAPTPPAARSLSALVWTLVGRPRGFPLLRHTVLFSRAYEDEFKRVFEAGELPDEPTVYVCAQDRGDEPAERPEGERLLVLVNAPANGDTKSFGKAEIEACRERTSRQLERCGLSLSFEPDATAVTTPTEFARLFPATGGALYGRASHGWLATFQRPDGLTRLPGLFLAGGSVHPGPGVPMAALSGRLAAKGALAGLTSRRPYRRAATSGGMSTR